MAHIKEVKVITGVQDKERFRKFIDMLDKAGCLVEHVYSNWETEVDDKLFRKVKKGK